MMVAPCVLVVHTHEYLVEVMSSRVFVVDLKNSHERDHWNDESRIHPLRKNEKRRVKRNHPFVLLILLLLQTLN